MRLYLTVLLSFSVIAGALGSVGLEYGDPMKLKGHPNECYSFHIHGYITRNTTVRLQDTCAIIYCDTAGNVHYTGCGTVAVAPPCYVVDGKLSKPFPDCCYEIECP